MDSDIRNLSNVDASKTDANFSQSGNQPKKFRKRKKQIHHAIRDQMHFYFGDANLSKDRFLKNLITDDPFVPLDVFMTFNRIKDLTDSVRDIEIAICSSDILELSPDRKSVRRITEIVQRDNVDELTIYVEGIPSTATHDWVKNIFSIFGTVAYISLPKYRSSGKIKEFAFVEFEQVSSVTKAIEAYKKSDGYLGTESNPTELCSITTYLKEQKETEEECADNNVEQQSVNDDDEDEKDILSNIDEHSEAATTSETAGDLADLSDADSIMLDSPNKRTKLDVIVLLEEKTNASDVGEQIKKKNRRKKVSARGKKLKTEELQENCVNSLRITTKQEWKRLRNKYLNLQREQMKEAKKLLFTEKKRLRPSSIAMSKKSSKKKAVQIAPNMNFYGANKDDDSVTFASSAVQPIVRPIDRKPLFSYEPGIIVKVLFDLPCVDIKEFKTEMRQHPFVKYIDVKEGDMAAYIRVDTSRSAPTLIKHCAPNRCQILTGETAEAYWEKINQDREAKLMKLVKVKPKRGRDKIQNQISTHIRFDE